ncbi:FtsX-like permease family protein [Paraclostridium ghonii]|uniref:FtsX-like permease family protein n=1 Tax=Paraclostridium ghonii TaxID=29358 RepID=UPI003524C0CD
MYFKIAIRNVSKSFKDYSIYFLTLTLAVSIFYSFNSIESQKAMFDLNKNTADYMDTLNMLIEIITIFVSFILGSLILYANNFLIKKRKKELGIYRTLGMGKLKISKILILETIIVGIVSLVIGLAIGFILSQGLSIFTYQIFELDMSEYKFIISPHSIKKTVFYFGIIYILVMMFNSLAISRYKIIDLITASKKNENLKFRKSTTYIITFLLSIVFLSISYKLVLNMGLVNLINSTFLIIIGFGILGTFLFFYSLTGVFIYLAKRNKNIYFKNLNIFIIKQLNSKVNTNFLSISIICLMLFLTIGILSTGISLKNSLEKNFKNYTPFDASAFMFIKDDDNIKTIEESLNAINFKFDNTEEYIFFNIYDSEIKIKSLIDKKYMNSKKYSGYIYDFEKIQFITISDYNNIRNLLGENSLSLKPNEVILSSNSKRFIDIYNEILEKNKKISLYGKEYEIKNDKVIDISLNSSVYESNTATLIVNDDVVKNAKPLTSNLNVKFTGDYEKSEKKFASLFDSFREGNIAYDNAGFIHGITKHQIYIENKLNITIVLFVGIYLGIIFLISSMAVLSIQQLSEANDSIDRYRSIERIGANEKMINKTIFVQTLIYFGVPISLAFIHSIVGIKVVTDYISLLGSPDIRYTSIITAIIFVVVYFGYFYVTYIGYKNIVKNSK